MHTDVAQFRFYEELNDLLPSNKMKVTFDYQFSGSPSIKDAIEAIGIPHTEVDLILANGNSVGFEYQLKPGDFVSVYPVFESLDISEVSQVRAKPLRTTKFILDVHLGKLAWRLRMLGFDTLYRNDYEDHEIVTLATAEKRIILTRDRGLLKNQAVTHGYWIRSPKTTDQIIEVLRRFDVFGQTQPFSRCMVCNGTIGPIPTAQIAEHLLPNTNRYFDEFNACGDCGKIYWKGSHHKKMETYIGALMDRIRESAW